MSGERLEEAMIRERVLSEEREVSRGTPERPQQRAPPILLHGLLYRLSVTIPPFIEAYRRP